MGQRFELKKGNKDRGCIKFVGETKFGKGIYIGIEFDEPYGIHNGSVKGKLYWKGKNKYCKFVRPDEINVGNYPVIDELDDLSNDDDDEL